MFGRGIILGVILGVFIGAIAGYAICALVVASKEKD